ncbi:hypothetical protein BC834DRAFT_864444 [Gloeopeniophorella convolvens]|nr:hypothetical protein BC834DRAFT_864444 [Gloeopeniophorella convolvens]
MTSTSTVASTSATALVEESRPQAGPLPSKRGEFGYVEEIPQVRIEAAQDALPARHPEDRRSPTPSSSPVNGPSTEPVAHPVTSDSSSMNTTGKRSFLRPKNLPKVKGVRLETLLLLGVQLLFFGGTVAAWAIAIMVIGNKFNKNSSSNSDPNQQGTGTSAIFIHVAFAVVVIAQLVFLERRIFHIRAERYVFKHPGEMLPSSLRRSGSRNAPSMPMAPWLRPPLPTYAAALAASGVGTGDAEDAEIAQPPPPAYGKTRGSTLLLAGFLRNSLRAQAREYEDRSASRMSTRSDRPVSFASRDEEWEERRDAARARRVEDALADLEEGHQPRAEEATAAPVSGRQ